MPNGAAKRATAAEREASLILSLARHLRELWRQSVELDEICPARPEDLARAGAGHERIVEEWDRTVHGAIRAAEDLILATRPVLLEEACIQLMIAADRITLIHNRGPAAADPRGGGDPEQVACERAIRSAIEVIQSNTGGWLDLREYDYEHYGAGLPPPYFEGRNRFTLAA